jgi:L-ascorbate metabolism protein UlaG (beta-lactamase superfamily)
LIITKYSWASICIQHNQTTLLIDPLADMKHIEEKPLVARLGQPLEPLLSFSPLKNVNAILVTHLHPDHFDHLTVMAEYGPDIPILIPAETEKQAKQFGFHHVIGLHVGDKYRLNDVNIIAGYSVDGFGAHQLAWIVESGDKRLIHCGDTLWHGYWWRMAGKYGPFNVACLPVNGAVLQVPGLPKQSSLPACLTPEEAVEAAHILCAEKLLPIHYGTFHNPPYYIETGNLLERLKDAALKKEVALHLLEPGQSLAI